MEGGLPKDILVYVLPRFLSPIDLTRLRGTCRKYYKWFENDQKISCWCMRFAEGIDDETILYAAAISGHRDLIDLVISKGNKEFDSGMAGASYIGDKDLVDFFIAKGADSWNGAIFYASLGGHRDLNGELDLFISKGADSWNFALYGASRGGHRGLVDFFDLKGRE